MDRCIAPRQPAADVKSHEVADVVDMQVTGKNLVELREVRPQGEQISHRTHSHIEQELVSVSQFNEIGDGNRRPGLVWHPGTEGGDSYLIGTE